MKQKLQAELRTRHLKLKQNINARGRLAAENLLRLMSEKKTNKAVLLLGGAHVPAALKVLEASKMDIYIFESTRYRSEKDMSPPTDD